MTAKILFSEFENLAETCGYHLLPDSSIQYRDSKSKVGAYDNFGYKYFISYSTLTSCIRAGSSPDKYSIKNIYTLENILLWISKNRSDIEIIDGKYESAKGKTILVRCVFCKHTWVSSWANIKNGVGCPCDDCIKRKILIKQEKYFLNRSGSMFSKFPYICNEWDYERNENLLPDMVTPKSHTKVWWKCSKCGHSWFARIQHRCDGRGCPNCKSSRGEVRISQFLNTKEVFYEQESAFSDCKRERCLPFDFWIPEMNLAIEYHGEQHYRSVPLWGGDKKFEYRKQNDEIKKSYCKKNKIKLIIIPYWDYDNIEDILENTFQKLSRRKLQNV